MFPYVIETRVEVWENEKLKWEHEPVELPEMRDKMAVTYANYVINGVQIFYGIA